MAAAHRSDNTGARFIFDHEQFVPIPYRDVAGNWTIGVGHLIQATEQHLLNAVLTVEQGFELFKQDLREREGQINHYITRKKSQSEFNALLSLVYNIGIGNFKNKGLAAAVQSKNSAETKRLWLAQNRDSTGTVRTGLTNRRKQELAIYLGKHNAAVAWASENILKVTLAVGLLALAAYWLIKRSSKNQSKSKK